MEGDRWAMGPILRVTAIREINGRQDGRSWEVGQAVQLAVSRDNKQDGWPWVATVDR